MFKLGRSMVKLGQSMVKLGQSLFDLGQSLIDLGQTVIDWSDSHILGQTVIYRHGQSKNVNRCRTPSESQQSSMSDWLIFNN